MISSYNPTKRESVVSKEQALDNVKTLNLPTNIQIPTSATDL
jgi:hypothetical protein